MKILTGFLSILSLLTLVPQSNSSLKSLVETEQAFSKAANEKSTREAFLSFIADDGILFRPRAVAGKKWLEEHPAPTSDKRPLLSWQPAFAEVSVTGDLGYTTGPWEFRSDRTNEKPAAFGDFVTVWKKQADGSWKFALDLGISHPQSSGPLNLWRVEDRRQKTSNRQTDVQATRNALVDFDNKASMNTATRGYAYLFRTLAHENVRLYRDGTNPVLGKSAATRSLTETRASLLWKTLGGDVSRGGDLGYTYGTYEVTDPATSKAKEKGNYLRIWKKQRDRWLLVLDLANPVSD